MSKEALKLALEALELIGMKNWSLREDKAIIAIKEALAQPEQEPVAWQVEMFIAGAWVPLGNPQRNKTKADALASNPSLPKENQRLFPVYAFIPPQRKPLTEEQIRQVMRSLGWTGEGPSDIEFARAIEAVHGIKE